MKRYSLLFILFSPFLGLWLLLGLLADDVQAIDVSGDILTDTVWTLADSPYVMTDTVTVLAGVTLTVEAGVEVQAQNNTSLVIEGHLQTSGTPSQPVTFTSVTQTNPDDWSGVIIEATGVISISNTAIEFAATALDINSESQNLVSLSDSYINNSVQAISVTPEAWHRLHMDNVTFTGNVSNSVSIHASDSTSAHLNYDLHLKHQPGLEKYEIANDLGTVYLNQGVMLTIEAGVNFVNNMQHYLILSGAIEASGLSTDTITFTLPPWGIIVDHYSSVNIAHTILTPTVENSGQGFWVYGSSNNPVTFTNSIIHGFNEPLVVTAQSLHRLQMENVNFNNNVPNRILVDPYFNGTLIGDVTLAPQPGLEAYEVITSTFYHSFIISPGITMTLEPGTNLIVQPTFSNRGNLLANGTLTNSILLSLTNGLSTYEAGTYTHLTHTTLEGTASAYSWGFSFYAPPDPPASHVVLDHVTFKYFDWPLTIGLRELHLVELVDVTFLDNLQNKIFLETWGGSVPVEDVILSLHEGLEGYEVEAHDNYGWGLSIPAGVTMTLEPGVNLNVNPGLFLVEGNFYSNGTETSNNLIAVKHGPSLFENGSIYLNHTIVSGTEEIGAYYKGISTYRDPGSQVRLNHVTLQGFDIPLQITLETLPDLYLNQVTFRNNLQNRIYIDTYFTDTLTSAVVLTNQPGLDGYEVTNRSSRMQISEGAALTLEAGTSLFLQENQNLDIQGTFQANGTGQQPVTVTTAVSNTAWAGMVIDKGQADLAHATISQAVTGISLTNAITNSLTLNNSRIISAGVDGISVAEGTVAIACTSFSQNGRHGLHATGSNPLITIQNSRFEQNGVSGVTNDGSTAVDARFNWWGDPSGPGGEASGSGDGVFGNIIYFPWLNTPSCGSEPWIVYLPLVIKP